MSANPNAAFSSAAPARSDTATRLFNRMPFLFEHGLAHHPLFDIARLAQLAQIGIERDTDEQHVGNQESPLSKPERVQRMLDNMAQLGQGRQWLKVSAINTLADEYADLLHMFLRQVEAATECPIRARLLWAGLDVFMNSPHMQVPYHFDHDSNFLMQIRGRKDVFLFDPNDRSVLTEAEIEDYYRGNKLAGRYRDALNGVGRCFHLTPGFGVHHPPLAPHLIRNGSEVSVSAAFYFVLPSQERTARIYQTNHFLRKLGLHPRPPGQSMLSDWAKYSAMEAFSKSHPTSYDERLYAGVQRVASAPRLVKRALQLLRTH